MDSSLQQTLLKIADDGEIFKQTDFTNYYVSNYGRVYSLKTNKILKPYNRSGYACVKINKKNHKIHRLVAKAFVANDSEKRVIVHHKDGNKLNNNASNL